MEGRVIKIDSNKQQYGVAGTVVKANGMIAKKMSWYYAAAKVAYKSIDLVALFRKVWIPLANISEDLKRATEFIEATSFAKAIHEVISPNDRGLYLFQQSEVRWQKIAEKVSFACHTFLKMINALWQWELINLSRIAKYAIGHLPIFKLVTDGFYVLSCIFCVWDSGLNLINSKPNDSSSETQFFRNTQYMKIITYGSKLIVVPLALVLTALNIQTFLGSFTLLSLGVIGDAVGLSRTFYEYF